MPRQQRVCQLYGSGSDDEMHLVCCSTILYLISYYLPFDFRMRPWQNMNRYGICDCNRHHKLWLACGPAAYVLKAMTCVSHEQ